MFLQPSLQGSLRKFEALAYVESDQSSFIGDLVNASKKLGPGLLPNFREIPICDVHNHPGYFADQLEILAEETRSGLPHNSKITFVTNQTLLKRIVTLGRTSVQKRGSR